MDYIVNAGLIHLDQSVTNTEPSLSTDGLQFCFTQACAVQSSSLRIDWVHGKLLWAIIEAEFETATLPDTSHYAYI
jgi:hypothetical protein